MLNRHQIAPGIAFLALCLCNPTANAVVTFDWATVGNPGNDADNTGFGAVSYSYRISKQEVTNAQYTEFLNAADPTGTNVRFLYRDFMSSGATGGIDFNSNSAYGSKFQVKPGRANNPVGNVSFFDAMRFVNWLQNGQGGGSTESGVYTIGNGVNETRNPSATYFIPSENEWYKAAYHKNDGATSNYWDYPTSTNAAPFSAQPPGSTAPTQSNTANYYKTDGVATGYNDGYAVTGSWEFSREENYLTDVGAYTASVSPYGTFDQGGNVSEWNEGSSSSRGARGGGWDDQTSYSLSAANRWLFNPGYEVNLLGFRVATLLELTRLKGDFNNDGGVDAADYVIWRNGLATDAYVIADYNTWRQNFGVTTGGKSSVAQSLAYATVPEPLCVSLACSAMMFMGAGHRYRRCTCFAEGVFVVVLPRAR